MDKTELCRLAISAMENAYAPYSGYKVGAALLCSGGDVFTGCNIENASFSATVCAERTAIFKAVSDGKRDFEMMAVCGGKNGAINGLFPPCGVCRQVIAEFCPADFVILGVTSQNTFEEFAMKDLLPFSFGPLNIK